MVNLLIISNHTKFDFIINSLKSLIKVEIDIVGDFDHGMKDVIDKRPDMVFIQDQIAGVTGASVARHIKMLLGTGAPPFIFMHDGDLKVKPINGLYDYLIDLSQDNTKVLADVQSTIKVLLGPTWENFYIPSKTIKTVVKATLAVPERNRTDADKLVDDFISDLGDVSSVSITSNNVLNELVASDVSSEEPFITASSPLEQLTEIITEYEREKLRPEASTAEACGIKTEQLFSPPGLTTPLVHNKPPAPLSESSKPGVRKAAVVSENPLSARVNSVPAVHAAPNGQKNSASLISGASEKLQSPLNSPADFRIERKRREEEVAVEESMRAFEANYKTKTAARKRYQAVAVVLLLCLAGGGYLVNQKPHLLQYVAKKTIPAIVPTPATQPVAPVPVLQKSTSATQRPETFILPLFIPIAGHDRSFASQKPGWERYVGTDSEFRVFHSAGKLKAIQVLATKGRVISESTLKTILIELTGTSEYRITSLEQRSGFQIERATVNVNADLLIYRKTSGVHAFVVSLV